MEVKIIFSVFSLRGHRQNKLKLQVARNKELEGELTDSLAATRAEPTDPHGLGQYRTAIREGERVRISEIRTGRAAQC